MNRGKTTTTYAFCALLMGLGILLISSCGSGSSSRKANEVMNLRMGIMPSVDHLPFAWAQKQGIYDSLGLKLEIERFYSPMERDVALQVGQLDASISDYTSVMIQHAKGLPLRLGMQCQGAFAFITAADTPCERVEDLRGKEIALSSNTVIEYATDRLLALSGVSPEEVTKVEVQKIPLRLEMLLSGQIDAAILPEPFAQIALEAGLKTIPGVLAAGSPESQITGVAIAEKALQDKQEAIALLLKGYQIAVERIQMLSPTEWKQFVAQELGAQDLSLSREGYSREITPNAATLQEVAAWLKAKQLIPESYQPTQLLYQAKN